MNSSLSSVIAVWLIYSIYYFEALNDISIWIKFYNLNNAFFRNYLKLIGLSSFKNIERAEPAESQRVTWGIFTPLRIKPPWVITEVAEDSQLSGWLLTKTENQMIAGAIMHTKFTRGLGALRVSAHLVCIWCLFLPHSFLCGVIAWVDATVPRQRPLGI